MMDAKEFRKLQLKAYAFADRKIAEDVGFTAQHKLALVIAYEAGYVHRQIEESKQEQ